MNWIKIWELLKNEVFQKILLVGLVVLFFVLFMNQCENNRKLEVKTAQNNEALKGQLKIIQDKLGNPVTQTEAFTSTLKELKDLNTGLYNEVMKLKGQVYNITQINASFIDSIPKILENGNIVKIKDSKYPIYNYTIPWKYYDTTGSFTQHLGGKTKFSVDTTNFEVKNDSTELLSRSMTLNLVTGYNKSDKFIEVFVKPEKPTPGLSFNIKGAMIENKAPDPIRIKNRINFGPFIGVGVGGPVNSLQINNNFNWQIGFGIQYSVFGF